MVTQALEIHKLCKQQIVFKTQVDFRSCTGRVR